jgi:anti-sigma regulatory factor (Ser/Thr protein kinase)
MTSSASPVVPRAPRRHEKKFDARRDQVREARRFLAGILCGCPAADDVLLAASELAANAVLHSASSQPGGTFTVTAEVSDGSHVRIEVRDDGGPWRAPGHRGGLGGRGLDIIATLAASHGVSGDLSAGWTVWAVLPWHPAPLPPENGQPR